MWELASTQAVASFEDLEIELDAVDLDQKMRVLQSWFEALLQPRPLQQAFNELVHQAGQSPGGQQRRAEISRATTRHRAGPDRGRSVLGVELPIPLEHVAAMSLAVGEGLAMQNLVDPEAVPSTLFGDARPTCGSACSPPRQKTGPPSPAP